MSRLFTVPSVHCVCSILDSRLLSAFVTVHNKELCKKDLCNITIARS